MFYSFGYKILAPYYVLVRKSSGHQGVKALIVLTVFNLFVFLFFWVSNVSFIHVLVCIDGTHQGNDRCYEDRQGDGYPQAKVMG